MNNITFTIIVIAFLIITGIIIFTVKYTRNVEIVSKEEKKQDDKKLKIATIRTNRCIDKLNSSITKRQYANLKDNEKNNIISNIKELENLLNDKDYDSLNKKCDYIESLYKISEKKAVETLKK